MHASVFTTTLGARRRASSSHGSGPCENRIMSNCQHTYAAKGTCIYSSTHHHSAFIIFYLQRDIYWWKVRIVMSSKWDHDHLSWSIKQCVHIQMPTHSAFSNVYLSKLMSLSHNLKVWPYIYIQGPCQHRELYSSTNPLIFILLSLESYKDVPHIQGWQSQLIYNSKRKSNSISPLIRDQSVRFNLVSLVRLTRATTIYSVITCSSAMYVYDDSLI
jgi:hypothetical protein